MYTSLATQFYLSDGTAGSTPAGAPSALIVYTRGHESFGGFWYTWGTHKTQAVTFRHRDE